MNAIKMKATINMAEPIITFLFFNFAFLPKGSMFKHIGQLSFLIEEESGWPHSKQESNL